MSNPSSISKNSYLSRLDMAEKLLRNRNDLSTSDEVQLAEPDLVCVHCGRTFASSSAIAPEFHVCNECFE